MSLLFLSALSACTDLASRAEYLTGPEAFVWEDQDFKVEGQKKMKGSINLSDGELKIWFSGFPPGTAFGIGENTSLAGEEGYGDVTGNVASAFGSLAVSEEWNTAELSGLSASVTAPGGQAFQVSLPAATVYFPGEALREGIVKGPVLYEGETAGEAPIANVYMYNGYDNVVFGSPKTFADFDGVAVVTRTTLKEVVCDGYVDEAGNAAPNVILERQDARVDLYGRRSGKIVATHTFPPADDRCPDNVFSFDNGQQKRPSFVPKEAIAEWVESQLPTA